MSYSPRNNASLSILDKNTACKVLDKSSFTAGTHIPDGISNFFIEVPTERGRKLNLSLVYKEKTYNAYIKIPEENANNPKIHLLWGSAFKDLLSELHPDQHKFFTSKSNGMVEPSKAILKLTRLEGFSKYTVSFSNKGCIDMADKIATILSNHVPAIRITKRQENEREAREIIDNNLGGLTSEQLTLFFEKIDTDYWGGKTKKGRFGQTFVGNNRKMICENITEANKWIKEFWTTPPEDCFALVDRFMKENQIKGAKYGFPSLILYIRDPQLFNIWINVMWEGIEKITGESYSGNSGAAYEKLNQAINEFRNQYKLAPQILDIVLTEICKQSGNQKSNLTSKPTLQDSDVPLFTAESFELLEKMTASPEADTYHQNKEAIKKTVELPLQALLREAAAKLPRSVSDYLETEKKLFSRFLKDDYGQGGAWDYYWGALYPKGGKRTSDAQLFIWINKDRLEFGFYIGDFGDERKNRFVNNAGTHAHLLEKAIAPVSGLERLLFGTRKDEERKEITSIAEWLRDVSPENISARVGLKAEELVTLSKQTLVQRVARLFEALFPFVLMASSDDPLNKIAAVVDDESEAEILDEYTLEECAKDSGLDVETITRWIKAVERKGQAVIYGPPGTGKTFTAKLLGTQLTGGGDGFLELIQFHPTYAYEDFIQGIRPKTREDGRLSYPLVQGRFLDFCDKARSRKGICVLILDEINRANLSRVFGELMYLLEYRGESIPLAGGEQFSIPENIRIIGTMNTADRSIALVDHALRRRFAFLELRPNYEVLEKFHAGNGYNASSLVNTLRQVNMQIGDPHYELGISFFLRNDLKDQIEDVWRMEIEPYLDEYFFDQPSKVDEFRWDKIKGKVSV